MKKVLSIALISTILLAGCSTVMETESTSDTVTEVTAEATESETEIIETETTVEITEPEETVYIRTQEQIDAAWEARLDYNGNGLEEIPLMNYKGERYSDAPEYDNIMLN